MTSHETQVFSVVAELHARADRAAPRWHRWVGSALVCAQIAVAILLFKNWAYSGTYRLYLDGGVSPGHQSLATQRFDVDGDRVVPRIVTRGPDRVAFQTAIGQRVTVHAGVRTVRRASYAIEWDDGSVRHVLARGTVEGTAEIVCPYPTGNGRLEFVAGDALTWIDPRLVRVQPVGPLLATLIALGLLSLAWARRQRRAGATGGGREARVLVFKVAAVGLSLTLTVGASEIALRAMGDSAPRGILELRHALGELTPDERWEHSPRYGRRLRPNVDAITEWRYGDIVRMGYLPPALSNGPVHRFRIQTDAEGFRNPASRDRFDVAALGDSFTDAMLLPVEAAWPMRLEQRLGMTVQNYGTAGFGPQQERLVLQDIVAAHRPRVVVLAFFAGNDLFDAEAFEEFERSGGATPRAAAGWRIKEVVSTADTWYVVNALQAGAAFFRRPDAASVAASSGDAVESGRADTRSSVSEPAFDRGLFSLPVNGRVLSWAFMPPYLNVLTFSREDLARRRGWRLTSSAIRDMQAASRSFGAEFVVMFVPFKSQVYLPLLDRAMSRDALRSALQVSIDALDSQRTVDVEGMMRNRLALNDLMRGLCLEAGIPFMDTTGMLAERVALGENVSFPDESHLNEIGEAALADALAGFLRERIPRPE